jgi:hypothetical protein
MSLGQRFLSLAARQLSVALEAMNAQSCSNAAVAASEATQARRERDESDAFVGRRTSERPRRLAPPTA